MANESEMSLDEIRAVLAARSPCFPGCPGWGVYNEDAGGEVQVCIDCFAGRELRLGDVDVAQLPEAQRALRRARRGRNAACEGCGLLDCVCPCEACGDSGQAPDGSLCACMRCPDCGTANPFEPKVPDCQGCRAERTEIARMAELEAGWDPSP